jgi:hypothetical protein
LVVSRSLSRYLSAHVAALAMSWPVKVSVSAASSQTLEAMLAKIRTGTSA